MTWLYLVLFGVLVIIVIAAMCSKRENYQVNADIKPSQKIDTMLPTIVGGTTSSKLQLRDHTTNVRRLLGDSGTTILLIHNAPFDLQVWSPLYMVMQSWKRAGHRIPTLLSYDIHGHGTAWIPVAPEYNTSDLQKMAWRMEDFSRDAREVYDIYVKSGKIIVAGYGFGGSVAQRFALDYPQLVEKLFIFCQPIGPVVTGIADEYDYLVNWIASNSSTVTYLTLEQSFVQSNLCQWFMNSDKRLCPYPQNAADPFDTYDTVEYLLADRLMREASATTYLQVDKLTSNSTDYREEFKNSKLDFPIIQLLGDRDHYTPNNQIEDAFRKYLQPASKNTQLIIGKGKHGFVLINPNYIAKLLIGEDLSKDPLTVRIIT